MTFLYWSLITIPKALGPGAAGYSTQPHTMAGWLRNVLSLRTKIPHTICVGKAARVRVLLLCSLQNKLQRKATENRTSNKNNTFDSSFLLVKKKTPKISATVWSTEGGGDPNHGLDIKGQLELWVVIVESNFSSHKTQQRWTQTQVSKSHSGKTPGHSQWLCK